MMKNNRVNNEKVFLLNSTPWRESSLRIEVFSENHGRITLLARSARKRQSELRGILMPFIPIKMSWYGQNELRTLHRAEWVGGWQQPQGQALISALYINELITYLTGKEDVYPELFYQLFEVMKALSTQTKSIQALRYFEWQLLTLLGFAPDIEYDENGHNIQDNKIYTIRTEYNPSLNDFSQNNTIEPYIQIDGATLYALKNNQYLTDQQLQNVLKLNRMLLDFRLTRPLESRTLLKQMKIFHLHHYNNQP